MTRGIPHIISGDGVEPGRSADGPSESAGHVTISPMTPLSITWLGHSTFILRTPGGKRIILDPWVDTNPSCPPEAKKVGPIDLMLVTHGHADHTADVVAIARDSHAQVIAPYELSVIFQQKGLKNVVGMNPGGTFRPFAAESPHGGLAVTMVPAVHSSSYEVDGKMAYAGVATGYVMTFEDGVVAYYAGDTSIFSDMKLIGDLYRPSIAFLPIGDRSRWGRSRRRTRSACWELRKWCRCITAHSRC